MIDSVGVGRALYEFSVSLAVGGASLLFLLFMSIVIIHFSIRGRRG